MASPFRFFRKYTGVMLVILTVLLMVAFGLGDILGQYGSGDRGRGAGSDEVAVSWDGGDLTRGELSDLITKRQILVSFLRQILGTGMQAAMAQGAVDPQPSVQPLGILYVPESNLRQHVVLTKLYADTAREAGIVVSDETIRDYLTDLGLGKVTKGQMRDILGQMRVGDRGVTIDFIFDMLRDALLARNFLNSYAYTFDTTLPQQKFSDWLKVKDKVIVEAAAVRAEDYVSKVPDPTDAQLRSFYDEHKERVETPEVVLGVELPSAKPGFATPRRVMLQYAKAELASITDEVLDTITDEEIADYYEENKEQFIRTADLLGEDLLGKDEIGVDLEAPAEEAGEDAREEKSAGESGKAADEATTEAQGEESSDKESPSETDTSSNGAPEETQESEANQQPSESDSSSTSASGPFRFVALQEETTAEVAADSEAAIPTEDAGEKEGEEADEEPMTPSEQLFGRDPADDDMTDDAAESDTDVKQSEEPSEEEDKVEYEPLEDVKDTIRRRLAETKAFENQLDKMADLISPLKGAYDDYIIAKIDAKESGGGEEANMPLPADILANLKPFAEERGLEFAETADLSLLELRESTIGRTMARSKGDPRDPRSSQLWYLAFGEGLLKLYEPVVTYDGQGNGYLVVKVLDEPRKEPQIDEIRDEVVKAWKLDQAAELALKRAEEIATEAGPQGLSLRDFLAGESDIDVEETDPFGWYTELNFNPETGRRPLRLSTPEPLEAVGPEFMETVFSLEPGKLGAVLNHDHSIAYVVRVQHMEPLSQLRQNFLMMGEFEYSMYNFNEVQRQQINAALVRDLLGDSPLEWAPEEGEPEEG